MKKFILQIAVIISLLGFALPASAAFVDIPNKLCDFFPCPVGVTGVEKARSLTAKLVDNARFMVGAVAVLIIVIAGIKLIMAQGNEEEFTKQKTTLMWGIVGLFVVGLAGELSQILDVDRGGFLKDPNVMLQRSRLFNRSVEIIITFAKYIIGSIAVLFIVRNGLRLVLLGGNEEEVKKDKQDIFYALLGLVVILVANPVINKVFFKIDTTKYAGVEAVKPSIDVQRLVLELAGMTNIVAAIAGPFALLSLMAGALMYAASGGEEEKIGKAKKIMLWALLGLVVIYGAFGIVSTFVLRQFQGI